MNWRSGWRRLDRKKKYHELEDVSDKKYYTFNVSSTVCFLGRFVDIYIINNI
jgi:hypothetical protein